jgi:hypothetical protein
MTSSGNLAACTAWLLWTAQAVTFPTSNALQLLNNTVNATWPGDAFEAWCSSDTTCSGLQRLTPYLYMYPLGQPGWMAADLAAAVNRTPAIISNTYVCLQA